MACYQDHHHMAIDPLPMGPSSTPPDVSSIRCVFQGVARTNKQAPAPAATSSRNTTHRALHSSMALPEAPDSMENSESSISSCFQLSSNSDDDDDVSSSSTSSTLSPDAAASPQHEGPLLNLASLCAALPVKRGLSRYFSGKSQSFSSLALVSSVADLAKPENPYVKRRRTTAGDSLLKHESYPPGAPPALAVRSGMRTTSTRVSYLFQSARLRTSKARPGHILLNASLYQNYRKLSSNFRQQPSSTLK